MIVEKTIMHILNKSEKNLLLTDFEGKISQNTDKVHQKLIKNVMKDEHIRKIHFNNYEENKIRLLSEEILYDRDKLIENSKIIAELLFDEISIDGASEDCSLIATIFCQKEDTFLGLFKVDFKKSLLSKVEQTDGKLMVDVVQSQNSFSTNLKSKEAVIIGLSGINDEYHAYALDKNAEKEDLDSRFISNFLNATKVTDDKYRTKVLKRSLDTFILNFEHEDTKRAEDCRSYLDYALKSQETINPIELADKLFEDKEKNEILKELLEERDLTEEIVIDKKWIEKKTKKRKKKLDTGFNLEGSYADFEDPIKYSVKKNANGTIDIILKNVKFIEG